jgi:hypothetical protein
LASFAPTIASLSIELRENNLPVARFVIPAHRILWIFTAPHTNGAFESFYRITAENRTVEAPTPATVFRPFSAVYFVELGEEQAIKNTV